MKFQKETILLGNNKKEKAWYAVKVIVLLLASSFLVSFGAHSLIAPNNFAIGGIAGLAIILEKATGGKLPQSITVFTINLPLLIAAFFFVRRKFAVITILHVLMQTAWLTVMEQTGFPVFVFEEKIFAAITSGICLGVAIAFAFRIGGSTGGADVVAVMIQKKYPAPSIAWMLFIVNCTIIASSFFVYKDLATDPVGKILPLIMSVCEQYVESKINDSITNGFQSAIEFRVITDKPDEMAQAIMSRLSRGVTAVAAKGMYTGEEHSMVHCVIHRRQVAAFKKVLKDVDPTSFAVMSPVSQVLGLGFSSGEQQ